LLNEQLAIAKVIADSFLVRMEASDTKETLFIVAWQTA